MEKAINKRVIELIKYLNISGNEFAKRIGLPQTTFSNIINRDSDIKASIIESISTQFGDISLDWLITGKGEMLKSTAAPAINYERKGAPYYDVDFIGGFDIILNDQTINPDYYIDFEPYNKPDVMWCNITGHSMEPAINHGDMIAIKEVQDWQSYLTLGEIYAIVTTNDMRTVKKIRKGGTTEQYRLVPVNTADYDEQDIEKNKISKVFEVLGCMKRF